MAHGAKEKASILTLRLPVVKSCFYDRPALHLVPHVYPTMTKDEMQVRM
jgi:hypothetical protein